MGVDFEEVAFTAAGFGEADFTEVDFAADMAGASTVDTVEACTPVEVSMEGGGIMADTILGTTADTDWAWG